MKKTLLIFGAYGALGKGVISALLRKDYDKYYLFDFNAEEQEISDKRVININTGDLSDEINVERAFQRTDIKEGKLFLFSTVGGFFGGKELAETTVDDFDKMISRNVKTNFLIAKNFLNKVSDGGAICLTTALTGLNPEAGKIAYGTSKSALNYLVEALSLECVEKGICVTGIAPHIIDTPENRKWTPDGDYEKWQKPEEIGELLHFIFSNYNYLSGNIIKLKTRFRI
jgi:NAD(P)-dependent dehydrogenase (short-subunit alcohol dehydrogenase family)